MNKLSEIKLYLRIPQGEDREAANKLRQELQRLVGTTVKLKHEKNEVKITFMCETDELAAKIAVAKGAAEALGFTPAEEELEYKIMFDR